MTHICVSKLTIIGSDNGLSPGRRQAIIWTNAGILLIGPLGTNFSEILIGIQTFSFKKMHLKMSSAKGRLFSLGLNVLNTRLYTLFNPSPPGQNGRRFTYDIFEYIFMNGNFCNLIRISRKFIPKGPVDNTLSIGSGNGLAPNRRYYPCWPVHWRIYGWQGQMSYNPFGADDWIIEKN